MRTLILLVAFGAAFAAAKSQIRIVDGEDTAIEDYPFMANMQSLIQGETWAQRCGGSLLTSTAILSAAYCFEGELPSNWRAALGSMFASSDEEGPESIHLVSRFILHPEFKRSTMDNNVAMVHLSTPAVYSDSIKPARIAGTNYILPDGTQVTSLGWGSYFHGGWYPELLQHVDLNLINRDECAWRYMTLKNQPGYESWPDVSTGMLCAGILDKGGKGACKLDYGGPLVHDGDIVVGITSWSYKCAHEHYPGVYTSVSRYVDWFVANA